MADKKSRTGSKVAAIRIRGVAKIESDIRDTLSLLNLKKANSCIILEDNKANKGMLEKCKDYITWGELNDQTLKELKKIKNSSKENLIRLNPPRGGYERKGVKKGFARGGALGYRGKKINELIKKMI